MSGERYEQVGTVASWGGGLIKVLILREVERYPKNGTPVYVKVPDPERCPTCESDNPAVEIMPAHIESEDQVLGFLCGEGRCPDPWHSTPRPGE